MCRYQKLTTACFYRINANYVKCFITNTITIDLVSMQVAGNSSVLSRRSTILNHLHRNYLQIYKHTTGIPSWAM